MQSEHSATFYIEYFKNSLGGKNKILTGDLLASLVFFSYKSSINLGGVIISNTHITCLNLSSSFIDNFTIENSFLEEVDVSRKSSFNIYIKNCKIKTVYGIDSKESLPNFILAPTIDSFSTEPMNMKNRLFSLTPSQIILITILKKLFINSKSKEEKEILCVFTNKHDKQLATLILKLLHVDKIISRTGDTKNPIYVQKEVHKPRMLKILKEINNSTDTIWKQVSMMT